MSSNLLKGLNDRQREAVVSTEGAYLVLAGAGAGKASPYSEIVHTPQGNRLMGDLKVGDEVYNRFGKPVKVLAIHEQGKKKVFRVKTKDGRTGLFNDEHLFSYFSLDENGKEILKTKELKEMVKENIQISKRKGWKFFIPINEALEYPEKELSINPYTLGAFLGNGILSENNEARASIYLRKHKQEVALTISEENDWELVKSSYFKNIYYFKSDSFIEKKHFPNEITQKNKDKSIPEEYLNSSIKQRYELIQGLFDTSAFSYKKKNGYNVLFYSYSKELNNQVTELLHSLGYKTISHVLKNKNGSIVYRLRVFQTAEKIKMLFSIKSKKQNIKEVRYKELHNDRTAIVSVQDLKYEENMRCIEVDDPEHLYVSGNYIVSHNTNVLTKRISYLIEQGVRPWNILSITFTNKASREMKDRLASLIGPEANDVWMGTFHSICIRIIAQNGHHIGLEKFSIIDEKEIKKLLKEAMELVEVNYDEKLILSMISDAKNRLIGPDALLLEAKSNNERDFANIYKALDDKMRANGYIDFDDCIMKTVQLLENNVEVRDYYQEKFQYIHTDETQDTNEAQFRLLTLLNGDHGNIFAVGDIDQCHPKGTKVLTDKGEVNVEDLKNGDKVYTFNKELQEFNTEPEEIKVSKKEFSSLTAINNYMHKITLENEQSVQATSSHKVPVKLNEGLENEKVIALSTDNFYDYKMHNLYVKDLQDLVDEESYVWVNFEKMNAEDSIHEKIGTTKYSGEHHDIERAIIDINIDFNINNPTFSKESKQDVSKVFDIKAIHVNNMLSMFTQEEGWKKVKSIEEVYYEGFIYSLDVGTSHNYIAEGIVVDNCIYAFRGANIHNILNFKKYFPDYKEIVLEINYRSSANIVNTSNYLISHNKNRIEKEARTGNPEGSPIMVVESEDDEREAFMTVSILKNIKRRTNGKFGDFAILYRSNSQSRSIEAALAKEGIPYQVVSGVSFYDRKEIKDIVAYLRAINNEMDELAFDRIINVPKRGIGATTSSRISLYAEENNVSFLMALKNISDIPKISKKATAAIIEFTNLIDSYKEYIFSEDFKVASLIFKILEDTGYSKILRESSKEEDEERLRNLEELLNIANKWDEESDSKTLNDFLTETSLSSSTDDLEEGEVVTLMTVHASKGLEYPTVFVLGLEEGLFPHIRSIKDSEDAIEEERRLLYVAATRAEKNLVLMYTKKRFKYGKGYEKTKPSRFLEELPKELVVTNKK